MLEGSKKEREYLLALFTLKDVLNVQATAFAQLNIKDRRQNNGEA